MHVTPPQYPVRALLNVLPQHAPAGAGHAPFPRPRVTAGADHATLFAPFFTPLFTPPQALTVKDVVAKKKAAMPADTAKAIGRLSSGLYVVTAAQNNARSAMVASWVSQASFEPLGLTIAVAKDRAIESMMQVRAAALGLTRGFD